MSKETFERCATRRKTATGLTEIKCRLGLWYALGGDEKFVEAQALHYWVQYYMDGEYDELLAPQKELP